MTSKFMKLALAGAFTAVACAGAAAAPKELWSLGGFMHPESVYADPAGGYFVSNVNGDHRVSRNQSRHSIKHGGRTHAMPAIIG